MRCPEDWAKLISVESIIGIFVTFVKSIIALFVTFVIIAIVILALFREKWKNDWVGEANER